MDTSNKDKRYTMTRMDSTRLGKNYGYMARNLKNLQEGQFVDAAKAVLEHHFDNHQYCGDWCPRANKSLEERANSEAYYRCKVKDKELYEVLTSIYDNYTTLERLKDIGHGMDTNCNESFNNTMAWIARKNKTYCGTLSLMNRLSMAIGIHSLGLLPYFQRLFKKLGIKLTPNISHFLTVKDKACSERLAAMKTTAAKKERNKRKYLKLKKDTELAKKEREKREARYQTGINLTGEDEDDDEQPTRKRRKVVPAAVRVCQHPYCKRKGHSTTRSKKRLANPDRLKRLGLEAECAAAIQAAATAATTAPDTNQSANLNSNRDAADDVGRYDAMPFDATPDDSDLDLFQDAGTWSEDEDGNIIAGAI